MAESHSITRMISLFMFVLMAGWIGACASTEPDRHIDSGFGMDQVVSLPDSISSPVGEGRMSPPTNEQESVASASSLQDDSASDYSSDFSSVREISGPAAAAGEVSGDTVSSKPDATSLQELPESAEADRAAFPAGTLVIPEDSVNIRADTVITPSVEIERPVFNNLRLEVSVRLRRLYVISDEEVVASYPVAVGKPEWPTRTGRWGIYEVVWNPWWHPPDQEWAWGYPIMAPGDPDNPLGRAQLIYDAPRSIHGTINPSSIGKAVSHGSIRVENEVAMDLVRKVMEYSGIERDEVWFREIYRNRNRNVRFRLEQPVPIWVY